MPVDDLRKILAVPANVCERPSPKDWQIVETAYCELPPDFKEFLSDYGTGRIDEFLYVFNPASQNENLNLMYQIRSHLSLLLQYDMEGLRPFPTPGGVLPFGRTDNGDVLGWRVTGPPDSWGIVATPAREAVFQDFDVDFSRFIAGILTRDIVCDFFPDDFPSNVPTFESSNFVVRR